MSKTIKDDKARLARQLARKIVDGLNGDVEVDVRNTLIEAKELECEGVRYGNERKAMAHKKVLDRRVERKKLNKISF